MASNTLIMFFEVAKANSIYTSPTSLSHTQGDPEWACMDKRSVEGVPVKYAVLADLHDIHVRLAAQTLACDNPRQA